MPPRRRPPGRYDEPRALPQRRLLLAVGAAVATVALVGGYLLFARYTAGRPTAGVSSFRVVSDTAVDVRFTVRKRAAGTAYCLVRARGADGAQVGARVVRIGPAPGSTVEVTSRLPTTARAVTGEVDRCAQRP